MSLVAQDGLMFLRMFHNLHASKLHLHNNQKIMVTSVKKYLR